jgi:hypothetical protein
LGLAVKELVGNNVSGRSSCDLSYGKKIGNLAAAILWIE